MILPYDPRDPDGDCGMARSRFPDVPESYDITKVLGYCKALVARRDAVGALVSYVASVPDLRSRGVDAEYERLAAIVSEANDVAEEALFKIGDLVPTVIADLQGQRDALKEAIVAFVEKAAPEMPESLRGAVEDLLRAARS